MQGQLSEIAEALNALRIGVERGRNACVTMILGSVADASISVSHIFRFLEDLYRAYSVSDATNKARLSNARWLQDQFNDIWADVQSATATQIRNKKRRRVSSRAGTVNLEAESQVRTTVPTSGLQQDISGKFMSISRKRKAAVGNSTIDVSLPIGSIRMFFIVHRQSGKMLGVRLIYVPARHMQSSLKGVFAACLRGQGAQTLVRSLSTFQVVPEGSEALEYIRRGNLQAIRDLLATHEIHPNDRDEDGDSLLLVSEQFIIPAYLALTQEECASRMSIRNL